MLEEVLRGCRIDGQLIVRQRERRVLRGSLLVQLTAVVRPKLLGERAALKVELTGLRRCAGDRNRTFASIPGIRRGRAGRFSTGSPGVTADENRDDRDEAEDRGVYRRSMKSSGDGVSNRDGGDL
jgi:hypothetical protein